MKKNQDAILYTQNDLSCVQQFKYKKYGNKYFKMWTVIIAGVGGTVEEIFFSKTGDFNPDLHCLSTTAAESAFLPARWT